MSVQLKNQAGQDLNPVHIYYDMNLINNDSLNPGAPVKFQYKETRSNYFLQCPQDYYMSIVRFYLQTPTLPKFIPQINFQNSNVGATFPILGMSNTANTLSTFTVYLYGNMTYPTGTVVYLANNSVNNAVADASNTGGQYFRTQSVTYSPNGNNTAIVLKGYAGAVGNPSLYPAGVGTGANFYKGGTQTISYANIPITNLVFASSVLTLTTNVTGLTNFYNVGDSINILNSNNAAGRNQYNGTYVILTVASSQLTLQASSLSGATLSPYISGGSFLPTIGEYYNLTPYVMTMTYTVSSQTYTYSQALNYQSNDLHEPPPRWIVNSTQGLTLSEVTSDYYFVYTYEWVMNMLNQTMTNCFWGLNGLVFNGTGTVASASLPMTGITANTYQSPSIAMDPSTLTTSISADKSAFAMGPTTPANITIYFNQSLSTLLDSYPYQYPNVPPSSNLFSYILFSGSAGASSVISGSYSSVGVFTSNYTSLVVQQEHQTASYMNPVTAIAFSSTILPVVMQNIGTPSILNGISIENQTAANIFPVITDFVVPFSATNGYLPDITYTPGSEYRLVDLSGTSPANQVDIQVFWRGPYGLLRPFYVGSGCIGTLKLMFRRKDYNNIGLE